MKTGRSLRESFSFRGFVVAATLKGVFGDPKARIVTLRRRKKQRCARTAATAAAVATTGVCVAPATCGWLTGSCTWSSNVGGSTVRGAAACMESGWTGWRRTRTTGRFALHVGNLCRSMTLKAVAELERLHDSTVKDLSKPYMAEQVRRAGMPAPRAIGIDEIAIHKGHDYRVVVSDLERGRPIWFGGRGRSEADIDQFFADLGPKPSARIELAVMDMWRPFRNSVGKNAPNAAIVFDKFHIMRHLSDARDQVRRDEYKRLQGKDRSYIKGQRYTLEPPPDPQPGWAQGAPEAAGGQQAPEHSLPAQGILRSVVELPHRAWRPGVLRTLEAGPALAAAGAVPDVRAHERHWDGIAAYCKPENKVSLGLVEGSTTRSGSSSATPMVTGTRTGQVRSLL